MLAFLFFGDCRNACAAKIHPNHPFKKKGEDCKTAGKMLGWKKIKGGFYCFF
jgi:hypothetical protein